MVKIVHVTPKYDLILFGASGFTGQLIAQYLAKKQDTENFLWAIAGRDRSKLERICTELVSQPEIIVADVNNVDSIKSMTAQTKLLMNAVGPFNRYGIQVIKACLDTQTHYLDITGEPSFIAEVYLEYDKIALEKEVSIVNCCGFDSIPADFATYLTVQKMPVQEPKLLTGFVRTNATFSGGTLTTAIEALYRESQKKSVKVRLKKHPSAPKTKLNIHKNKRLNAWAIPMPVVDPHIVKRSAFRLPEIYGEAFSYGQYFLRNSFVKVLKTVLPIVLASILVRFTYFRNRMFQKFRSGTGPDQKRRAKSKFEFICFGQSHSANVKTIFAGGDPGYDETAKMFSESAFTLLDHIRSNTLKFGVLTPVEGLGMPLIDRLKKQGLHIETSVS